MRVVYVTAVRHCVPVVLIHLHGRLVVLAAVDTTEMNLIHTKENGLGRRHSLRNNAR
jgi:hypothetical protein